MKHRLRYSLLLLLSMFFSLSSQAKTFKTLIDGIYYSLDTETKTASVERNSNRGGILEKSSFQVL